MFWHRFAERLFFKKYVNNFREPYFWPAVFLVLIITIVYYFYQFPRLSPINIAQYTQPLVTWEFVHTLIGSLYYIPLMYSIIFFWWNGIILIWLLSIFLILPRLVYYYFYKIPNIFSDIFYLSIPVLLFAFISLELRWRDSERKIYEEKEKERQNYLVQLFKAQEDERQRIAQEIHDDSIQRLAIIAGDMQMLARDKQVENTPTIKKKADAIQNMIVSVSRDLRRITLDLRPTVLDDLGLVSAIKWLVEDLKQSSNIRVQMEINGNIRPVSNKVSIHIFRIIQEALNNIIKHSKASLVIISIKFIDNTIKVMVCDNGKGFNLPVSYSEFTAKGALGIIGMHQRAQFIGGNLLFESEVGKGTRISLEVKL